MPRKRSRRLKKKRTKRVLIKRTKRVRKSKSKSNVRRKTRKKRKKGGSSLCKGLTCDGVPRNPLSVEIINTYEMDGSLPLPEFGMDGPLPPYTNWGNSDTEKQAVVYESPPTAPELIDLENKFKEMKIWIDRPDTTLRGYQHLKDGSLPLPEFGMDGPLPPYTNWGNSDTEKQAVVYESPPTAPPELIDLENKFKEMKIWIDFPDTTLRRYQHLKDILSEFYPHFLSELKSKVVGAIPQDNKVIKLIAGLKNLPFKAKEVENYPHLITFLKDMDKEWVLMIDIDIDTIIENLKTELMGKYQRMIDVSKRLGEDWRMDVGDMVVFNPVNYFYDRF